VPPNTFRRTARWTPLVYGVSPAVGRLVPTLQDNNLVCIPFHLLLSVYVIARPNFKRPTLGSLLQSIKFEMLHVVPFIGLSFSINHAERNVGYFSCTQRVAH